MECQKAERIVESYASHIVSKFPTHVRERIIELRQRPYPEHNDLQFLDRGKALDHDLRTVLGLGKTIDAIIVSLLGRIDGKPIRSGQCRLASSVPGYEHETRLLAAVAKTIGCDVWVYDKTNLETFWLCPVDVALFIYDVSDSYDVKSLPCDIPLNILQEMAVRGFVKKLFQWAEAHSFSNWDAFQGKARHAVITELVLDYKVTVAIQLAGAIWHPALWDESRPVPALTHTAIKLATTWKQLADAVRCCEDHDHRGCYIMCHSTLVKVVLLKKPVKHSAQYCVGEEFEAAKTVLRTVLSKCSSVKQIVQCFWVACHMGIFNRCAKRGICDVNYAKDAARALERILGRPSAVMSLDTRMLLKALRLWGINPTSEMLFCIMSHTGKINNIDEIFHALKTGSRNADKILGDAVKFLFESDCFNSNAMRIIGINSIIRAHNIRLRPPIVFRLLSTDVWSWRDFIDHEPWFAWTATSDTQDCLAPLVDSMNLVHTRCTVDWKAVTNVLRWCRQSRFNAGTAHVDVTKTVLHEMGKRVHTKERFTDLLKTILSDFDSVSVWDDGLRKRDAVLCVVQGLMSAKSDLVAACIDVCRQHGVPRTHADVGMCMSNVMCTWLKKLAAHWKAVRFRWRVALTRHALQQMPGLDNLEVCDCAMRRVAPRLVQIVTASLTSGNPSWQCPVCYTDADVGIRLQCGHVLCVACSDRVDACPMCRVSCSREHRQKVFL